MKRLAGFISVLLLTLSIGSLSFVRAQDVDRQMYNQHRRIYQGVRSGELTPREANRLMARERAIREQLEYDRANGNLTPSERWQLRRELRDVSYRIRRQKHDWQRSYKSIPL